MAHNRDVEEMAVDELRLLVEQLVSAIDGRDVIGMAKGVLMATGNLTADAAFEVLRRASQRENRKLRDIAQEIVNRQNDRAGAAVHLHSVAADEVTA